MIIRSAKIFRYLRFLNANRMSNQPKKLAEPSTQAEPNKSLTKEQQEIQKQKNKEKLKQLYEQHLKLKRQVAQKLGQQVAQIQTPTTVITEEETLKELIKERRQVILETNKIVKVPKEFLNGLTCFLVPILAGSLAMIYFEATQNFTHLSTLHSCMINFNYLNIAFLSGIDLSCMVFSHCLSVNTVETTPLNWIRMISAALPVVCCGFLSHYGFDGLNTFHYFAAMYICKLDNNTDNSLTSSLYKDQGPVWLFRAKTRHIVLSLLFVGAYYVFASSKNPEDLRKPFTWKDYKLNQAAESLKSLKLSDIK